MPAPTVALYDSYEHEVVFEQTHTIIPDSLVDTIRDIEDLLQKEVGDDYICGSTTLAVRGKKEPPILSTDRQQTPSITVPLSSNHAKWLYDTHLKPAVVGVEGKGDAVRPELRKCREIPVNNKDLESSNGFLPDELLDIDTHHPEINAHILESLARTCSGVRCVPYKVIGYGKDDYFRVHVDSMEAKNHIGSLVVLLPVLKDEVNEEGGGEKRKRVDSQLDETAVVNMTPDKKKRLEDEYVERSSSTESSCSVMNPHTGVYEAKPLDPGETLVVPGDARSGELRFFPCRTVAPEMKEEGTEGLLYTDGDLTANEMLGGITTINDEVPRFDEMMVGRLNLAVKQSELRNCLRKGSSTVPTQYAAWLGDVPHEVSAIVRNEFRFVATYKIFADRQGSVPVARPGSVTTSHQERLQELTASILRDALPLHFPKGSLGYRLTIVDDATLAEEKAKQEAKLEAENRAKAQEQEREALEKQERELAKSKWGSWLVMVVKDTIATGTKAITGHTKKAPQMPMYTPPEFRLSDTDINSRYGIHSVGFVLRHLYPPASLGNSDSVPHLKGLDLILFEALRNHPHLEIRFFPATEFRYDVMSAPFKSRRSRWEMLSTSAKKVHEEAQLKLMADEPSEEVRLDLLEIFQQERRSTILRRIFNTSRRTEGGQHVIASHNVHQHPCIGNCVWIELGLGEIIGGGHCLGNCDCPVEWWYRHMVMTVSWKQN